MKKIFLSLLIITFFSLFSMKSGVFAWGGVPNTTCTDSSLYSSDGDVVTTNKWNAAMCYIAELKVSVNELIATTTPTTALDLDSLPAGTMAGYCKTDHLPYKPSTGRYTAISPAYLVSDSHGGKDCKCGTGWDTVMYGLLYVDTEWDTATFSCIKK